MFWVEKFLYKIHYQTPCTYCILLTSLFTAEFTFVPEPGPTAILRAGSGQSGTRPPNGFGRPKGCLRGYTKWLWTLWRA